MSEIPLKLWRMNQAALEGVSESAVAMKMKRGGYKGLRLKRINARVVFVLSESPPIKAVAAELPMKHAAKIGQIV